MLSCGELFLNEKTQKRKWGVVGRHVARSIWRCPTGIPPANCWETWLKFNKKVQMRQHSSPVDCKDPLTGNQNYPCTTAPCKGRDAQIPRGNAALWPSIEGSTEQPNAAEITIRKYNSPEYWEPNLHRFMTWPGFYWSHLYTITRSEEQSVCEQTHLSGMVHPCSSASH